jgi:nitric oxide reductase large subunit
MRRLGACFEKTVDTAGSVVFNGADIQAGQEVFFKYGLMEHGTLWAHELTWVPITAPSTCTG